jgi:hypothetical protein
MMQCVISWDCIQYQKDAAIPIFHEDRPSGNPYSPLTPSLSTPPPPSCPTGSVGEAQTTSRPFGRPQGNNGSHFFENRTKAHKRTDDMKYRADRSSRKGVPVTLIINTPHISAFSTPHLTSNVWRETTISLAEIQVRTTQSTEDGCSLVLLNRCESYYHFLVLTVLCTICAVRLGR